MRRKKTSKKLRSINKTKLQRQLLKNGIFFFVDGKIKLDSVKDKDEVEFLKQFANKKND